MTGFILVSIDMLRLGAVFGRGYSTMFFCLIAPAYNAVLACCVNMSQVYGNADKVVVVGIKRSCQQTGSTLLRTELTKVR